jgi:hypothetical protein
MTSNHASVARIASPTCRTVGRRTTAIGGRGVNRRHDCPGRLPVVDNFHERLPVCRPLKLKPPFRFRPSRCYPEDVRLGFDGPIETEALASRIGLHLFK